MNFFQKKQKKIICFEVENYEDVASRDPLALSSLEQALALAGALPARIDYPERIFCVTIENSHLSIEELLSYLENSVTTCILKTKEE